MWTIRIKTINEIQSWLIPLTGALVEDLQWIDDEKWS